jgi:hypothetical protein
VLSGVEIIGKINVRPAAIPRTAEHPAETGTAGAATQSRHTRSATSPRPARQVTGRIVGKSERAVVAVVNHAVLIPSDVAAC